MNIRFYTDNLNPRLYERLFREYIWDMFNSISDYKEFLEVWQFEVRPSWQASDNPHFHGQDGVGGVTGYRHITLYLEDKKTDLIHDIFLRVLRKNLVVATHEFAHGILQYKDLMHRVPLRHTDFTGTPKGTMLNFATAEVHDRHTEGKFKKKNVWFWDWKTFKAYLVRINVIDIDDLV